MNYIRFYTILFLLFFSNQLFGQQTIDTFNKNKFVKVQSAIAGISLGTLLYLNNEWYTQFPKTTFHFFDDNYEWLQMDKCGHVFSAYFESNLTYRFYKSTGLTNAQATNASWLSSIAYQGIIEFLDAYSENWGFSKGDMGANFLGATIFAVQQHLWKEQRIQVKFGFYPKHYQDESLNERTKAIFGNHVYEQLIKDYNAQSYWLSGNLNKLLKTDKFPKWLNIAVGYSAENVFEYALRNQWLNSQNQWIDKSNLRAYREFLISPDIDLAQLPIRNKNIKRFMTYLTFKIPLPTLIYQSDNRINFSWFF